MWEQGAAAGPICHTAEQGRGITKGQGGWRGCVRRKGQGDRGLAESQESLVALRAQHKAAPPGAPTPHNHSGAHLRELRSWGMSQEVGTVQDGICIPCGKAGPASGELASQRGLRLRYLLPADFFFIFNTQRNRR